MPPTAATAESAAPPPAKKPRVEKEKSPKEKYQPAPPVPIREIPIKTNGAFERNADRGAPLIPRERWEDMPAWYIQGQDRGPKVVCGDCYGPLVEEKQDGRIYKDCFFCEERPAAGEPILACRKCKWSACQTCDGTSRYVPRLPELEDDSLFHGPNSPAVLVPPAARTCAAAALGTVIVCPGGNYEFLCAHEAFPVAAWLASHGIAAVVLRYRLLPKYGLEEAMDDLEAAVAHVRKTRGGPVGAIGFSAGSHLIASLCRRARRQGSVARGQEGRRRARPDRGSPGARAVGSVHVRLREVHHVAKTQPAQKVRGGDDRGVVRVTVRCGRALLVALLGG